MVNANNIYQYVLFSINKSTFALSLVSAYSFGIGIPSLRLQKERIENQTYMFINVVYIQIQTYTQNVESLTG